MLKKAIQQHGESNSPIGAGLDSKQAYLRKHFGKRIGKPAGSGFARIGVLGMFAIICSVWVQGLSAKPLPIWNKTMQRASVRFEVLASFQNQAVLDKETGLVWQRTPSTSLDNNLDAQNNCYGQVIGGNRGRRGWRLPAMSELLSLIDSTQFDPPLAEGHPFIFGPEYIDESNGGQNNLIWTSSLVHRSEKPEFWVIRFSSNVANLGIETTVRGTVRDNPNDRALTWCVRGGVANP